MPIELFNKVKAGLPAYDNLGRRVVDLDTLPFKQKQTYEEIEAMVRSKLVDNTRSTLLPYYQGGPVPIDMESGEEIIPNLCKAIYEGQPDEPLIPPGCVATSFTLPAASAEVPKFFERFMLFQFKYQEVIDFEQNNGFIVKGQKDYPLPEIPDIPIPHAATARDQANPESFIRSLVVSYENDSEIRIKAGTQKQKICSCEAMGFKKNSITWRTLLQILQIKDHLYHLGVAHGPQKVRNKSYDINYKRLVEISKKFVSFLNNTYRLQLPDKYQIFELVKNEHPGIYRPKFIVSIFGTEDSHYDTFSNDELIKEIEDLSDKLSDLKEKGDEDSEKEMYKITNKIQTALVIAHDNGWITRNRVASYLNPKKSKIVPDFPGVYDKKELLREDD